MNKQIKDLKEQALIWAVETLDPDALNDNEWAVAIDEKFAELIVRECDRYAKSAWEHGPLLGRDLLIHFGIVEAEDN